jgi:hypothetical protein
LHVLFVEKSDIFRADDGLELLAFHAPQGAFAHPEQPGRFGSAEQPAG